MNSRARATNTWPISVWKGSFEYVCTRNLLRTWNFPQAAFTRLRMALVMTATAHCTRTHTQKDQPKVTATKEIEEAQTSEVPSRSRKQTTKRNPSHLSAQQTEATNGSKNRRSTEGRIESYTRGKKRRRRRKPWFQRRHGMGHRGESVTVKMLLVLRLYL